MTRPQLAVDNEDYRRLVSAQYAQSPLVTTTYAAPDQPRSLEVNAGLKNETRNRALHRSAVVNGLSSSSSIKHGGTGSLPERSAENVVPMKKDGDNTLVLARRGQLARAKSDYEREVSTDGPEDEQEFNWEMRHGWEDQYRSEEYLHLLSSVRYQTL